ncbi:hypothetical protein [Dactylosporangium darangshiense]|uniref:Uncharacterized protein n=1 Tax=Dactylosporangium darangshiense TaxID=579108 RepID=A0ABP8DA14_9ACTN
MAKEAERAGRSIRAVLIDNHIVTEEQLTAASADAHGIATLDLVGYPIAPATVTKIPMAQAQAPRPRHRPQRS